MYAEVNRLITESRKIISSLIYSPKLRLSRSARLQYEFLYYMKKTYADLNMESVVFPFRGFNFSFDLRDRWDAFNLFLIRTRDTRSWYLDNIFFPELYGKRNFLDIGANNGINSILASGLTSGIIMSFEVNPFAIEKFNINVETNKEKLKNSKINIFPFGLSDVTQLATLKIPKIGSGHATVSRNVDLTYETQNVQMKRLDELNLEKGDVIRIDVEGSEMEILKGGRQYFSDLSSGSKIFITWNPKENAERLLNELNKMYELQAYRIPVDWQKEYEELPLSKIKSNKYYELVCTVP